MTRSHQLSKPCCHVRNKTRTGSASGEESWERRFGRRISFLGEPEASEQRSGELSDQHLGLT